MLKYTVTIILGLSLIAAGYLFLYPEGTKHALGTPSGTGNRTDRGFERAVLQYTSIAKANYEDSWTTATRLKGSIDAFLASPSASTLSDAKIAWKLARKYYQQTEVFRFGNPEVDAWEGKVNAWPLDEGLIDYVEASSYANSGDNPYANANIIANPKLSLSGKTLDTTVLNAESLQALHEVDGVESNVATGYHAIEFLLWGQDLHGHNPGAGDRKYTDYDVKNCTGGNCKRRADYLIAVADLLIADLHEMVSMWGKGGAIFQRFMSEDKRKSIGRIITGMGSLSYGELAGERTMLGLLLGDPEEEHDCFSDNTHASHFYNVLGLNNVLKGEYRSLDGKQLDGIGISDLAAKTSPNLQSALHDSFAVSLAAAQNLVDLAAKGQTYDVLIKPGNKIGNLAVRKLVDALKNHTSELENAAKELGLSNLVFEGSDSLEK